MNATPIARVVSVVALVTVVGCSSADPRPQTAGGNGWEWLGHAEGIAGLDGPVTMIETNEDLEGFWTDRWTPPSRPEFDPNTSSVLIVGEIGRLGGVTCSIRIDDLKPVGEGQIRIELGSASQSRDQICDLDLPQSVAGVLVEHETFGTPPYTVSFEHTD